MKRILLIIAAVLGGAVSSQAHNRIVSTQAAPEGFALKYVYQTDSTTQVYGTFVFKADAEPVKRLCLPQDVAAECDGKRFSLKEGFGIAVADTAGIEYNLLERDGQKLNFILEFEKFPTEAPFGITSGDGSFNFSGICAEQTEGRNVDAARFLKSTKVTHCGLFETENGPLHIRERDSIIIAANFSDQGKFVAIMLTVENCSDHGVLVNREAMKLEGRKGGDNDEYKPLIIASNEKYVNIVEGSNWYAAQKKSGHNAASTTGDIFLLASLFMPMPVSAAVAAASTVAEGATFNKAVKIKNENDAAGVNRKSDDYIISGPLRSGESVSGVIIAEKPKRADNFVLTIPLDGYDFIFCTEKDQHFIK